MEDVRVRKTFLMCEPKFFGVEYVINPHMEGNVGNVDRTLALKQWHNLHSIISSLADVQVIDQAPHLPDMVFTANAGLVFCDLQYVWLSRFAVPERRGEERLFTGWFIAEGLDIIDQPPAQMNFFEGAGDGLVDANGEYWLGHGMRSSQKAIETISKFFHNRKFHHLELKDPRFYHLDTCFAPLSKGHYLWYPQAFTTPSYWYVAMRNGRSSGVAQQTDIVDMLIDVDESDAMTFACNVVNIDNVVIIPECSPSLVDKLTELGYEVISVDLSEFIKAGGAAKCLTLQLR
jgi:N-dimethylarginine dimethylaminohydrolase